jgi:putative toxin-antitoxin system antitoxin component (TIGR02293 family)
MDRTKTESEIRRAALDLRTALGLSDQTAPDIRATLTKLPKILNVQVTYVRDSDAKEAEAWVNLKSRRLFVRESIFNNLLYGDARSRWTVAHELGHLVLEHKGRPLRRTPGRTWSRDRTEQREREANIFASEFLVPGHLAKGKTAEEIRRYFQVSGEAAAKRFVELKSTNHVPLAPAARGRPDIVNDLVGHGYSENELSDLVVPRRTLARRRSANELLTVEETDKALRLKRIATLAEHVFGDPAKAHRWLRKPKRSLAGDTPLAYLASENGARIVEEMLGRIEHGIYA